MLKLFMKNITNIYIYIYIYINSKRKEVAC